MTTYLTLADGTQFTGTSPFTFSRSGEVVFTTGMTGYVESLTDPSYEGQIIVFTYPLIGNYGVLDKAIWESEKIHAAGVVVSEACLAYSHPQATESFLAWLERYEIPLLTGVDTRSLTKYLRTAGTVPGCISADPQAQPVLDTIHPVERVTPQEVRVYNAGAPKKLIAVDCGVKENSIRLLTTYPLEVHRVPATYDYSQEVFDGVFISNGPGDPSALPETVAILQKALERQKPVFGICLGNQLLALAAGGTTYKLPFGHRGHNQPVQDCVTGECAITSQNHGYAVAADSLPDEWRVRYRNVHDGSVEGIEHEHLPFFAVQFHPEAAPGPTDTRRLFERFYQLL